MDRQSPVNDPLVLPTEAEMALARESSRRLAAHEFSDQPSVRIQVLGDSDGQKEIDLPLAAVRLLQSLLDEMSEGRSVALVSTPLEVTLPRAADLLNVSIPYLIQLVDEGQLSSRLVGASRRVRLGDLLEFKRRDDAHREQILDELTAEAQALNLGY
jgi:excisionase family DNA binding protein